MGKQPAKTVALTALLACATVAAYVPAIRAGFIRDDESYLTGKTIRPNSDDLETRAKLAATLTRQDRLTPAAWRCHRCLNWLM